MSSRLKIAAVQMDISLGELQKNTQQITDTIEQLADQGVSLIVFPECALCGYCYQSLEEAREFSESVDGPHLKKIASVAVKHQTHVVVGLLESKGEEILNTAALLTASGSRHFYRKAHLPHLGVDRFTTPGNNPFDVVDLGSIRVGVNICYDCSFPEPARVLALAGADLIILPTNWPPGAIDTALFIPNARALENHVYYAVANRVGTERGFDFIGRSKICHPCGQALAEANHNREEILIAEIDPEVARNKHLVRVPGQHEIHRFNDRRPELYGVICERATKVSEA